MASDVLVAMHNGPWQTCLLCALEDCLSHYGNQEDVVEVEEEDTEPRIFRAWEEKWERRKMNKNASQYLHAKMLRKYGGLKWIDIEGEENPEAGPPCLITAHPEEMYFKEDCRRYRYLVVGMKEGFDIKGGMEQEDYFDVWERTENPLFGAIRDYYEDRKYVKVVEKGGEYDSEEE